MADVFISYASEDRDKARLLASFLEAEGYSVWWDASLLTGAAFRKTIMVELARARAVIVIWTDKSIESDWVQSEAGRGHADRKLIPVKARELTYQDIPPPFDNLHTQNIEQRDNILAAVVAQLAKPEAEQSLFVRAAKRARFELLSWFGIMGAAVTMAAQFQGVVTLSRWVQYLTETWSVLVTAFWQHLLFFLPALRRTDAMLLTFGAFILGNFLSCVHSLSRAKRRATWVEWGAAIISAIFIFIIFVEGLSSVLDGGYLTDLLIWAFESRWIDAILWLSNRLSRLISLDMTARTLYAFLYLLAIMPLVLGYLALSTAFSLKLDIASLSRRLSRIAVLFLLIAMLNQLSLWLGAAPISFPAPKECQLDPNSRACFRLQIECYGKEGSRSCLWLRKWP